MIKTIYLDMDGVLCDFMSAVVDKYIYDPTKNTINWDMLKHMGSEFWANLQWIREGERLYAWLYQFCIEQRISLCILSSIGYREGKIGKKQWIEQHMNINPMCIYFVDNNNDKMQFAEKDALLIDDYGRNVARFIQAGGQAIKFNKSAKEVIDKLKLLMDEE